MSSCDPGRHVTTTCLSVVKEQFLLAFLYFTLLFSFILFISLLCCCFFFLLLYSSSSPSSLSVVDNVGELLKHCKDVSNAESLGSCLVLM